MDYRLVLLTLALIAICDGMRHQSIAVKGKLLCGTAPARNVRVKLWEEDSEMVHWGVCAAQWCARMVKSGRACS
ncbi:Transthyretin-like protein 46 [Toxocara canis]|uniref:Transthyretin-like protein 46 n=1 Tax=Toxocara canis TaxID=6265 RepID=A0A0B2W362_TOXCA|nr:Transthyretin-like protein 46 [Toxocara canis]